MNYLFDMLKKNNIGEPPWDYYFLENLPESEYPKYLAKLFKLNTGENLPLKYDFKIGNWVIDKNKCKTFNQKLQWIKLYGVTDLMRKCTDKVTVRDYVREKIGEEYLKPVLQIIDKEASHSTLNTLFDKIDFDKLPNSFVIKTNHGCKWHYIIKDKEAFLQNKRLFEYVKRNITGWLEQDYSFWGGFELQYKGIKSQIIIEEFLGNEKEIPKEIEVYCFNGHPKIILKLWNDKNNNTCLYDENLNYIDDLFFYADNKLLEKADILTNNAFALSQKISKDFLFVRVDWMINKNKLYFEELTYSPYSGFSKNLNIRFNKKLGKMIVLGR